MSTNIFLSIMLVTFIVGYDIAHTPVKAGEIERLAATTHTTSPEPIFGPSDIQGYIHYKFGEHASDALKVLTGSGNGSCAENITLSAHTDNDNRTWGGIGVDRGYWQINSFYHPNVSDSCARDVKCSTDYAYEMWKNDGESFKRWTCGRVYGI
jgi:hypothetical protein